MTRPSAWQTAERKAREADTAQVQADEWLFTILKLMNGCSAQARLNNMHTYIIT